MTRDDASFINIDLSSLVGTVTSVDVQGGVGLTSSGSPITSSGTITVDLDDTGVVAGSYNNPSNVVVNAQGQVTSITAGTGSSGITESTGSWTGSASIVSSSGTNAVTASLVDAVADIEYTQHGNLVYIVGSISIGGFSITSAQHVISTVTITGTPPFSSTNTSINPLATYSPERLTQDRVVTSQARINPATGLIEINYHNAPTSGTSGGTINIIEDRITFSGFFAL